MLTAMDIRKEMARLVGCSEDEVTLRFQNSKFHVRGELVIGFGALYNSIYPFDLKDFVMELPDFSKRFLVPAMHNLNSMRCPQ